MKKILILGAAMPDILIQDGVEVGRNVGGCACNIADTVRHFGIPYTFFSPIGTGEYGDYVRRELGKRGISSPVSVAGEHGCCRCYLEPRGTVYRGDRKAEYGFVPELLDRIDPADYAMVCVPGIEIREYCGNHIVDWLEQHRELPLFYAPGPHLPMTPPERVERMLDLGPQIHLNDEEICQFTGREDPAEAAKALFQRTGSPVWVTCGPRGSLCYDGALHQVPAEPAETILDTVGAGDSHLGSVLAGQYRGLGPEACLKQGGIVARAVIGTRGSLLADEVFETLFDKKEITL